MPIPELLTVPDFIDWARIGRTKVYEELAAGGLRALKIGRRTLIKREDAIAWLEAQPTFGARAG